MQNYYDPIDMINIPKGSLFKSKKKKFLSLNQIIYYKDLA